MAWRDDAIRDRVIRTILGESNGSPEGMVSVAHVMKNRADSGAWGDRTNGGLTRVITAPKQFSMWNTDDPKLRALAAGVNAIPTSDPRYQRAAAIADGVFSEQIPDNTNGATHYHMTSVSPDWSQGQRPVATIGGHYFYKLPLTASNTAGTAVIGPSSVGIGGSAAPAPAPTPAAATAPITPIQSFTGGDYGRQATAGAQPFKGIVIHIAGKPDLQSELAYNSTPDANRGGAYYGYHYLVDRDGKVYQTAPDNVRTNHIQGSAATGLNNENAIGVSFIGGAPAGKNPLPMTPEQQAAGVALVNQLKAKYNIDPSKIVSHGELDASRASGLNPDGGSEGKDFITAYRASQTSAPTATTAAAPAADGSGSANGFVYGGASPQDQGVDLRHLEPVFRARIDKLQADAAAAGIKTHITDGYRDNTSQAADYAKLGAQGLAAAPGSSYHQFGRAVDLVADNPAQQQALIALADQPGRGITAGAHFATPDRVHFQAAEGKTAPLVETPGVTPSRVGTDANSPLGTASPGPPAVSTIVPNPANVPAANAQPVSATAPAATPGSDKYSVIQGMTTGTGRNPMLYTAANWGNLFGGSTPAQPTPDLAQRVPLDQTPTPPVRPADRPAPPAGPIGTPASTAPIGSPLSSILPGWGAGSSPYDREAHPSLPPGAGMPGGEQDRYPATTEGQPSMGYPAMTNPFGQPQPDQQTSMLPGSMLASAQELIRRLFPSSIG